MKPRRSRFFSGMVVRGQTTAEYAILTFWTVIVATSAIQAVRLALLDFYYDLVSVMCLPIP